MSDRLRALAFLLVASGLPGLLLAEDAACTPLPAQLEICTQGSDWADADVLDFENGVLLDHDDFRLELIGAPEPIRAAQPLDAALPVLQALISAQAANDGLGQPEWLADRILDLDTGQAITLQTRIALPEDDPIVFLSMILEQHGHRLLATISFEPGLDLGHAEDTLVAVAALIRPQPE